MNFKNENKNKAPIKIMPRIRRKEVRGKRKREIVQESSYAVSVGF